MKLYGLIGYPLTHSFSKKYFTEKFEKEGLSDCRYENFPISRIDELKQMLKDVRPRGLNVTIPYKEKVIGYLDFVSELVQKTGACNCIRIDEGKLLGYNTDVIGFEKSLFPLLESKHQKALVLGSGGASKSIVHVLEKLGISFQIVSRHPAPGQISYHQITAEIVADHLLIINTTPLGMYPDMQTYPPIPYEAVTGNHFLFDLIYNPEITAFLKKGAEKKATICNGMEMLRIQAEESWRIWNNLI